MWKRLGELQQAKDAKDAQRAAREQKQQARQAKEKQREIKDSLGGHVVSMHVDRIDDLYKLINSDELTASATPDDDAPCPLDASVQKSLLNLGCTQQHIHDATVGLGTGAASLCLPLLPCSASQHTRLRCMRSLEPRAFRSGR